MKDFIIKFSLADSEYMTALRLAVGAVCAVAETDIDCAEDMKVCVTESCLVLKSSGFEGAEVKLGVDGGVHATVEGAGGCPCVAGDSELSLALISALVADFELEKKDGVIYKLTLKL